MWACASILRPMVKVCVSYLLLARSAKNLDLWCELTTITDSFGHFYFYFSAETDGKVFIG